MGKLFNLKEWLTVADAARHLSIVFSENVTEADVLRLALDGHLRLSVNFVNHANARLGKVIPLSEAKTMPGLFSEGEDPYDVVLAIRMNEHDFLELNKEIVSLRDVWDLPMIGSESLDVEHKYQQLTGGPEVTLTCLEGTFVQRTSGGICQLQESYDENQYQRGSKAHLRELEEHIARNNIEPSKAQELLEQHKEERKKFLAKRKEKKDSGKDSENYFPAGGLPTDSVLVVRTAALREFQDAMSDATDLPHQPGPKLVPRHSVVDEEVIAYWKKKRSIGRDEISALLCGINPFAWEESRDASLFVNKNREIVSAEKRREIDDVKTLLADQLDPLCLYNSLMEWKSALNGLSIPLPVWLENLRIEGAIIDAPACEEKPLERPLEMRERATLLAIIAVLAKEAKIDWQKPSKAAELIVSLLDQDGLKLGQRTVEEHLKRIPDALERKSKT